MLEVTPGYFLHLLTLSALTWIVPVLTLASVCPRSIGTLSVVATRIRSKTLVDVNTGAITECIARVASAGVRAYRVLTRAIVPAKVAGGSTFVNVRTLAVAPLGIATVTGTSV
jgi:hypothetical protein